jgi:hypothetical protein
MLLRQTVKRQRGVQFLQRMDEINGRPKRDAFASALDETPGREKKSSIETSKRWRLDCTELATEEIPAR